MTLRKLTLSVSLLVASLMLAAPAQPETWTCAFINPNTQKPEKLEIVRDGGTFIEQFNKTPYRIMQETENTIQLFFVGDVYPDMPLILMIWKKAANSPRYCLELDVILKSLGAVKQDKEESER